MRLSTAVSHIRFGSKAETLVSIESCGLSCTIPACVICRLKYWKARSQGVLKEVAGTFPENLVAVRSSAQCEDGPTDSQAGAFASILNVNPRNPEVLTKAIEQVFASYPEDNPEDQVLIQEMVQDIDASGVILTRCVDDGSPYYVLSYDDETGDSESITSGKGKHKTVLVYRKFKPEYCDSRRVQRMLALAQEMEDLCGNIPLDIKGFTHNSEVSTN